MLKRITKHIALNLIVVFLSSNCNSSLPSYPTASAIPQDPTSINSLTPLPTSTLAPEPTSDLSLFLFDSFQMESEQIGWGTAQWSDAQGGDWSEHVLRTADGGLSWRDVSPSTAGQITSTFFLDGEHAWAVVPDDSADPSEPRLQVWQTQDGGQTWTRGDLSVKRGMLAEQTVNFVDSQHGWFLITDDVAMGTTAVSLYRTEDGGTNWEQLLSTSLDQDPRTAPLPLGCYKEHISFRDVSTGWVMGGCWSDNDILLMKTTDGGHSWTWQDLPKPESPIAALSCSPSPPAFFSSQNGILQIICQTTDVLIYQTHDGGKTWDIPAHRDRMLRSTPVDFVDMNQGWQLAAVDNAANFKGIGLYVTDDGGKTWNEIFPHMDLNNKFGTPPNGNELELVNDFDFIDLHTGFALLSSNEPDNYSVMLKTTDGGFTWIHWVPHLQNRK